MPAVAGGIRGIRVRLGDRTVIGLVLGGIAAVLTVAFLVFFEPVERTSRTTPALEARRNPFLAAERFLRRAGFAAETTAGRRLVEELPAPGNAMLLADRPGSLTAEQRQGLDAWMANGGHLIVLAIRLWDEAKGASGDDFLDRYGLRQYSHGRRGSRCSDTSRATADLPGTPRRLQADFRPRWYLQDASGRADGHVAGPCGRHLLTYAVDEGRLTVVTDTHPWHNHAIGDGDHAFLLGRLLALTDPDKVWILRHVNMPGLGRLLWQHGREALIAAGVLLIFALWAAYDRFGPPLAVGRSPRRSLAEHLDAVAAFQLRHGRYERILAPVRERLEARLERRLPQWREWGRDRRAEWLAEHTGLAAGPLDLALHGEAATERELVTYIETLQELGRRL